MNFLCDNGKNCTLSFGVSLLLVYYFDKYRVGGLYIIMGEFLFFADIYFYLIY